MYCPKCGNPQVCGCPSCKNYGQIIYRWTSDRNSIICGYCGLTMSADWWETIDMDMFHAMRHRLPIEEQIELQTKYVELIDYITVQIKLINEKKQSYVPLGIIEAKLKKIHNTYNQKGRDYIKNRHDKMPTNLLTPKA